MAKKTLPPEIPAARWLPLRDLRSNPDNPRVIRDDAFAKLVESLRSFPQMLRLRPLVVASWADPVILGGNMRYRAAQAAGVDPVPVLAAEDLTPEQRREFVIKDNVSGGEWDWDALANEWDPAELAAWGLDLAPMLKVKDTSSPLSEDFLVPPFSILDSRQKYWTDRKEYWNNLIQDKGESRQQTLYKGGFNPVSSALKSIKNGVSILDPVLAEIAVRWFGKEGGRAFDCFAGDSVFGYVAAAMGQQFTGIELRQEQADLNNQRTAGMPAKYICDDGRNVGKHLAKETQDLLFSCPPYYDLEVYSDLPNDASNQGSFEEFMEIIKAAFVGAINCLKNNSFAVIVVGDVRNKKNTAYLRFPDLVIDIFEKNGMSLLNELILVEKTAGSALRARGAMKHRKVIKTHQNVLVFYKGNPREVSKHFPEIELTISEDAGDDAQL